VSGISLSSLSGCEASPGLINAVAGRNSTGIRARSRARDFDRGWYFLPTSLTADFMIRPLARRIRRPARCSIGKRRPAAICCRPRWRRERRRGEERLKIL